MKLIALIISFLAFVPLTAQMEFERVWQVFPEGGYAQSTQMFFKHDTILISTQSTHSGKEETNYFYTTDEGRNWTDLRENFKLGTPVKEKYDFLGVLHPLTFEFVKYDRVGDTTTFIYYMNLQGELHKKVSYPYHSSDSQLKLNPIDPDFISLHKQTSFQFPLAYYHDVGYSSDRGETWSLIEPEEELKKQRDLNLIKHRKIDYKFSSNEKGKMIMEFIWDDGFNFSYQLITGFNYLDYRFDFSNQSYTFENILCYECFFENNITFVNVDREEFDSYDLFTGFESIIVFKDRLPFLNSDSLEEENKVIDISGFWGEKNAYLKSNLKIKNHKVLYIPIRSEYLPSYRIEYINQLFFQTFDNGETWEYLFNNDNLYHQVVGMFINHENSGLWILKDSTVSNFLSPLSWNPILYKSKTSLTSVENQSTNHFQVSISKKTLIITSDEYYNNAEINLYNTNGQLLMKKIINIQAGENAVYPNNQLNEKLILIQINTNQSQIFKLIRSD